jgi:phytanoyl-CoA hydroxylase
MSKAGIAAISQPPERSMGMTEAAATDTPIRRSALTAEEIESFAANGFLRAGRLLSDETLGEMRDLLDDVKARERARGQEYDLLDPSLWPDDERAAALEPGKGVGFLFNLWLAEPAFRAIAFEPALARWAAQLIGARQVRLLEDNALYKDPRTGGELKWHQDFSYWPLAQPNAATAWIALDDVTADNGAVQFAGGSHLLGERLPAVFGTGTTYLRDQRPASVKEMADPGEAGLPVQTMEMLAGEVSFHHSLTWHASGPNRTDRPRRAYVIRYAADGTIWLGSHRYEYNYSDEEVGIPIGAPLGGRYFPVVPF